MTHDELVIRACRWLRSSKRCHPVFAEFQHLYLSEFPDCIGWTTAGTVHVVEVKVSRADFQRDGNKSHAKWGHSMGHRRWYAAPRGLVDPGGLDAAGLIEPSGRGLRVVLDAPVRTMTPDAHRDAHSILRNALIRHEAGVEWYPDTFRFQTLAAAREAARERIERVEASS